MKFVSIDGDDFGKRIEQLLLENEELKLKEMSTTISHLVEHMTAELSRNQFEIIIAAGDTILCKKARVDDRMIRKLVRAQSGDYTFSVGIGNSLREAYLALNYAKSIGKKCFVELSSEGSFEILK